VQLGSTFEVAATPDRVFDRFLDANVMQSCIPGCAELVQADSTHYSGRLVNEIAHVRFNAAFSLEITEISPPHSIHALLQGDDSRLGSSLKINATLFVEPIGTGRSKVDYTMDVALWGKLGRLGQSIFQHRTAQVQTEFVERFSRACIAESAAVVGATDDGHRRLHADDGAPATVATAATEAPPSPPGPAMTTRRPSWFARLVTWLTKRGRR
jgi:carbon monoxide dehydrogenase subunit G